MHRPLAGGDQDADPLRRERETRLVARQVSEIMLARGLRWQQALEVDRLDSLLFHVVCSASLAHLPLGAAPSAATAPRPISLLSTAQSMHLPYETVRRRLARLRARGLIASHVAGAHVPLDLAQAILESDAAAAEAAMLAEVLATLDAQGYAPAARRHRIAAVAPPIQARALLDFSVRVMEGFLPLYGGFVPGTVVSAIIAANVRHLVRDPGRNAGDLPADHERRPVAVRALARDLGLPWETVRRQVAALAEAGTVAMVDGGGVVPSRIIAREAHQSFNRHIEAQFDRMLAALARL